MGNRRGASALFGVMWGKEQDSKEAFLEEIMHKLRAEEPIGGIQGVGRGEGVVGKWERKYTWKRWKSRREEPAQQIVGVRAAQDG